MFDFAWVNKTAAPCTTSLPPEFAQICRMHHIDGADNLDGRLRGISPDAICFDFSSPTAEGLDSLKKAKASFRSVPFVMVTEVHSESLAVWALRNRIWDYIVKPFSVRKLVLDLLPLMLVRRNQRGGQERPLVVPTLESEREQPLSGAPRQRACIARALHYLDSNLGKRITEGDVAERCGMSRYHFCRVFHQTTGTTFTNYLLQLRIKRAQVLLARSHASVTIICYEVGFRDLSYFGRVFRAQIGLSPSEYRQVHAVPQGPQHHSAALFAVREAQGG